MRFVLTKQYFFTFELISCLATAGFKIFQLSIVNFKLLRGSRLIWDKEQKPSANWRVELIYRSPSLIRNR